MHLFLDNSQESLLLKFIIKFLQLERYANLKITYIEDYMKNSEHLKLSSIPILFEKNSESMISSIKIIEVLIKKTNTELILNPGNLVSQYIDLIKQNNFKELLKYTENNLESKTFLETDSNLTMADIILFVYMSEGVKNFDDTEKFIYNDTYRWAFNIQNLPSVNRVINEIKLTKINQIDLSQVIMKKVKKALGK